MTAPPASTPPTPSPANEAGKAAASERLSPAVGFGEDERNSKDLKGVGGWGFVSGGPEELFQQSRVFGRLRPERDF